MKIFTWKQRILILVVTLVTIGIFGFIGFLIGSLFDQWKLGLALGALISYPFTQWALIRSVQKLHNTEKEEKN